MLKKLFIRNYILIDELDIDFDRGLSIVTGETGAGKSILLGALSLILGQRADTASLLDKKKKCIVEGHFTATGNDIMDFFQKHDLDAESELCLRREINAEGKSRAFINDTPVNLSVMRELSDRLIDVHSQHETLTLANSAFQLSVVDAFAGHQKDIDIYRKLFREYTANEKQLKELIDQESNAKKDLDYLRFQFDEIDSASLKEGEQQMLEDGQQSLTHAEEIRQHLNALYIALKEDDDSVVARLSGMTLASIASYGQAYRELGERIRSSVIELKDIADEAMHLSAAVKMDPEQLDKINERLNTIYRLQQKHRVGSVEELMSLKEEFSVKLNSIGSLEENIESLRKKCEQQFHELEILAAKISAKRMKSLPGIEKAVKKILGEIAMPNAVLSVKNNVTDVLNADGFDRIQFYFSANKGSEAGELGKVASGGEMSRLMLAIKSLMASLASLPTIIFDEIDTGISGEVAARVGQIMQEMAARHQVIAITHLPQIAGKGHEHFVVYKNESLQTTRTSIRKLDADERVNEIARMLSGQKLTGAALEHAKELLST